MNEGQANVGQGERTRKRPVRSPYLFPSYNFGVARRIAERIELDGAGSLSEETLAMALGMSAKSSGFRLRTLTARQFRLVAKHGDNLVTTPLAKAILKPTSEVEMANAIAESFMTIPLFKEVATRFKGQPLPQGQAFRNILERELRIETNRVSEAERVLMESAREAGLLYTTGDKTYLRTQAAPAGSGVPEEETQPPDQGPPIPPGGGGQRPLSANRGFLYISEADLADLKDDDFKEIWGALGKLIRIRGKGVQTEEKQK